MSKAQMPFPNQSIAIEFDKIRAAHEQIRAHIHRTPVLTSDRLNEASHASLFFKCENFQKIAAFNARRATNGVFSLDYPPPRRGVHHPSSSTHDPPRSPPPHRRDFPPHN